MLTESAEGEDVFDNPNPERPAVDKVTSFCTLFGMEVPKKIIRNVSVVKERLRKAYTST